MFELLRRLLTVLGDGADSRQLHLRTEGEAPPAEVVIAGEVSFPLGQHMQSYEGYPVADWDAVQSWVDERVPPDLQARAWAAAERAWLLHFKEALGPGFRLSESSNAVLLSSLEPNVARATIAYMERTLKRVIKTLHGIAQIPLWGSDLLIVFDDAESYYRYVSYYYPDAGEFAFSGGMHQCWMQSLRDGEG